MHLQLDIDTLQNNIYIEKMREVNANADYEKLIEGKKKEKKSIEATK